MIIQGGSWYLGFNIILLLICFFYCIIESQIKKNERKYVLFIIMLGFSFLMARRPTETKDTLNYIKIFENIDISTKYPFHLFERYQGEFGVEYGFLHLVQLIKKLQLNYKHFFFMVALFNIIISVNCLQRMKNYLLCEESKGRELYGAVLTGYVAYVGVLYNGIGIRAGISISISLVAFDCYIRKKYIKTAVYGIIALSFQRICVVLLLALVADKVFQIRSKKQCMGIWLAQGIFLVFNIGDYFLEMIAEIVRYFYFKSGFNGYSGYLYSFDSSVGKRDWLIWLVIGVCIWAWTDEKYYKFFLHIVLLGGWFIVFLHGVRAISRMYDYYIMFCIPMLGAKYYQAPYIKLSREKLFVSAVVVALAIMQLKLSFF